MAFRRLAGLLLLATTLAVAGCDGRPPDPAPDRDELYQLFERAADFAIVLDRLDIICAPVGEGDRIGWVKKKAAPMLDADQKAKLDAFITDRKEAVFENYRKSFCGMEVSAEQKNYVAAYKVHRARLLNGIQRFKEAHPKPSG